MSNVMAKVKKLEEKSGILRRQAEDEVDVEHSLALYRRVLRIQVGSLQNFLNDLMGIIKLCKNDGLSKIMSLTL